MTSPSQSHQPQGNLNSTSLAKHMLSSMFAKSATGTSGSSAPPINLSARFTARRLIQTPTYLRHGGTILETGTYLHYVSQGDPAGEAIVFLHDLAGSWFSFSRILPLLSARYHAFALDLRGHGDSDKGDDHSTSTGITMNNLAGDVATFIREQGLRRVTLVGHGVGGYLAQRIALKFPDVVSRLVLIGATGTPQNNMSRAFDPLFRALSEPVPATFVRAFYQSQLHNTVPEAFLEGLISESLKTPASMWQATWTSFFHANHDAHLSRIWQPTLLAWGDQDDSFSASNPRHLAARLPNATRVTYAGIGHAIHWEHPQRFAHELVTFMNQH
ncbi:MAG: alpha/beta hydrolase [Deinococcota bacterium]